MMIDMDDFVYLLWCKLVNVGFICKWVKDKEVLIVVLCDILIDVVCECGECDFVWDLVVLLLMVVIGDMFGVCLE